MKKHSEGFERIVDDAKSRITEVSLEQTLKELEDGSIRLIDVREDHEWEKGYIPGAEHIGKGIIERDIELKVPDHSTALVLYCGGGYRSALAADNLQKMGYSNVRSMAGGFRAYQERNG